MTHLPILALDPGSKKTGWVIVQNGLYVTGGSDTRNEDVLDIITEAAQNPSALVVCEHIIAMYGESGADHNETVFWAGRYFQRLCDHNIEMHLLTRQTVKAHICGTARVKDKDIHDALTRRLGPKWIDPPPGSPKKVKRLPGPTHAVTSHQWAALAVALTFADTYAG